MKNPLWIQIYIEDCLQARISFKIEISILFIALISAKNVIICTY